jgi:DNA-binding MarR family transcriptional regulator
MTPKPSGRDPAIDEIASSCLAVRARAASRWISALYEKHLAAHGVSVSQVNLLVAVGALGRTRPSRLGGRLSMERSTVSRNLKALLDAGWLRAEGTDAGRVRTVELTPAGRARVVALLPAWRKAQAEAAQALGESGVAAIHRLGKTSLGA